MPPPWTYDSYYNEWECSCGKFYPSLGSVQRHLARSSRHDYCTKCDRDYDSYNALTSHFANSRRHAWCSMCAEDYGTSASLQEHYEQDHSSCKACSTVCKNDKGLHEHARQSHSERYCTPCRRMFQSPNNLDAHMNSSTHKTADFPCPLPGCKRKLISQSALILHWESGSCASGCTRQRLDAFVRSNPAFARAVINPRLLLTSSSPAPSSTTYIATNRSWNSQRQAFVCYLCDSEFGKLAGLNQHLASPRHTGPTIKTYRCPGRECGKEAVTLSALWQHIEKGSCGLRSVKGVQSAMDSLISNTRRIAF